MRFEILYYVIRIRDFENHTWTDFQMSSRIHSSGKMFILGTTSKLIMLIVTFLIILHFHHVASMKFEHVNANILCNSEMMSDLYSRIQMTPFIFLAKVLKKDKVPGVNRNWQLVAYVKVQSIIKDIFTPPKLSKNYTLWIGPFSDQINNSLCMPLIKINSSYLFFSTHLSQSRNSFQSLYKPILYSRSKLEKVQSLMTKPMKQLVITNIPPYTITIEGKIEVACHTEGFPMPQYFWLKNHNEPIPRSISKARVFSKVQESKSVLHIENVEKSDEANYTCHAENIYGFVENTFRLKVKVTEEFKRKCYGIPFYCVHGICSKGTCKCNLGFLGRRCNYHDPYYSPTPQSY